MFSTFFNIFCLFFQLRTPLCTTLSKSVPWLEAYQAMAEHAGLTLPQALEKPGPSRIKAMCRAYFFATFWNMLNIYWNILEYLGATAAENSIKSPVCWPWHGRHIVCWHSWLRRFSNCRAELAQVDPNSEAWGNCRWLVWLVSWLVLVSGCVGLNTFERPGCKGATGRNGPIRNWPLGRPDRRQVKHQTPRETFLKRTRLQVEEFCRAENHIAKKSDMDWLWLIAAYLLNNPLRPWCIANMRHLKDILPPQPCFRHRTCWMVQ